MNSFRQYPNVHTIGWAKRIQDMYPEQFHHVQKFQDRQGTVAHINVSTFQRGKGPFVMFRIFNNGTIRISLEAVMNKHDARGTNFFHCEAECLQYIRHFMEHLLPKAQHEYLTSLAQEAIDSI